MTEASDAENTAPRYVFVLIHGTFAPRAAWVQDETSLLRTTLERAFPNALFDSTFVWRGFLGTGLNNTHGYRIRAAHRLQKHLKELRAANPKAKIFAIAHSHGGNVLLYAAHDETVAPALDGAICMATPFFVTKADEGLLSVAQGWFTLIKSLFVFGGSLFVPPAVTNMPVMMPLLKASVRIQARERNASQLPKAIKTTPMVRKLRVVHRPRTKFIAFSQYWKSCPNSSPSASKQNTVPPGHEVRPEQIDVRHAASRFRMIGATWIKHCEIYLNTDALDSMSAWVRLRSEHASAPCSACEKLKSENGRSLDEPLQHGASWLDGIGSSRHSGMRFN